MAGGNGDMTLAFELSALQALADPGSAFSSARDWTEYLGVVAEDPTYVVTNFTRQERIRQDFFSGPRGVEESLESVRTQFETDRYVFIGTSDADADIAAAADWEYLSIEDAAAAAEWPLASDASEEEVGDEDVREDWP